MTETEQTAFTHCDLLQISHSFFTNSFLPSLPRTVAHSLMAYYKYSIPSRIHSHLFFKKVNIKHIVKTLLI